MALWELRMKNYGEVEVESRSGTEVPLRGDLGQGSRSRSTVDVNLLAEFYPRICKDFHGFGILF